MRGASERSALLVIDVQDAILKGREGARAALTQAALEAMVVRVAALGAAARARGVPVIHVQHDGPRGHRLETGTAGWQIRAEILGSGDQVVHKTSCDSFFRTELESRLRQQGVERLVVCGCMTQYCVDTTCRRAVTLGFDVDLVANGHMTADTEELTFERVIRHHNSLLDGFDAGAASIRALPADQLPPW